MMVLMSFGTKIEKMIVNQLIKNTMEFILYENIHSKGISEKACLAFNAKDLN
jgi:hypothetical protein